MADKDDVKKGVDDMLDSFLQQPPGETPPPEEKPPEETLPPEETPPEEKPPEEKPPEEKPPEEAPPEEKPPEETPPAETPPEETPPAELTVEEQLAAERARTEKLLKHIEKISGESVPTAAPEAKPPEARPPAEEQPSAAPPAEIKVEEINFLEGKSQEDVEKLIEDPQELNKLLNQIYMKAIETSIPLAQERTMLNVPQVTASYIKRYNTMKALVDDFYKENEDLKVVKRSVGMIANEVHAEHPDWTIENVFKEAATRTRDALGLTKPAAKPASPTAPANPSDPAFAQPRGSRQRGPAKKLTGMQKEINDLIE